MKEISFEVQSYTLGIDESGNVEIFQNEPYLGDQTITIARDQLPLLVKQLRSLCIPFDPTAAERQRRHRARLAENVTRDITRDASVPSPVTSQTASQVILKSEA